MKNLQDKIEERYEQSLINSEYVFRRSFNQGFLSRSKYKPTIRGKTINALEETPEKLRKRVEDSTFLF